MKLFIVALLFVIGAEANFKESQPTRCGFRHTDHKLGTAPWLATIRAFEFETNHVFTICSGSIVHPKFVLTAAQCFLKSEVYELRTVVVGVIDVYNITFNVPLPEDIRGELYPLEKIIIHPNYEQSSGRNDIALIRLGNVIKYGRFFQPICLPLQISTLPEAGKAVHIPIWTNFIYTYSISKTNITTQLLSNAQCQNLLPSKRIDSNSICTLDYAGRLKTTCDANVGAPLMSSVGGQWYVEGILSRGLRCNEKNTPAVYTKVSNYAKWLKDSMSSFYDDCVTPDNKRGQCIPILACPVLYKAFANPRKDLENYWSKFICVSKSNFGEFQVCCPNATTDVRADDDVMGVAGNLSNKQFCGYQHRDDYISEDSSIAIDEFPWVAIIRAIDPSTLKETSLCSGSLINRGYILTSAYCVTNWKNSQITYVRLGEFNIKNKTDCVNLPHLETADCSEVVDMSIDKFIVHPFYNSWTFSNDLALLKLNKTVVFNDYIRPICLPEPGLTFVKTKDTLYTSSFTTAEELEDQPLKKKLSFDLTASEDCNYRKGMSQYKMCLKPNPTSFAKFACFGDDGASAMFAHRNQWTLEGITTDRVLNCFENRPIMVTRISKYLKWIKANVDSDI